ncbi:hypothetical protein B0H14DRAFT_3093907 [Mycena olivaceomarginata]|nr:hypothetical protein B0H14DRAFT_3093907 [Mycena olivaceomarginata]
MVTGTCYLAWLLLPSSTHTPLLGEPPDGGLDAWLTVLGSSLVALSTLGVLVNGYGAFNDYYETTYLSNYSATGHLHDRITKPQQIYQQFLTQVSKLGGGIHSELFGSFTIRPFCFLPGLAVCAHWFKRRLAFAIASPWVRRASGAIIYPIMLNRLIPKIGFGWTVRILAFIVLACFTPLPPLAQLFAFRAFRDVRFALICAGGWFTVFSTFNPFFYVGGSTLTPYFLAIMCATAIVGRICQGISQIGFNVISFSTLLSGILILALWYTSTAQPNLIAFSAVYGFASGPFFSLVTACVAQISPVPEVGARIGMVFVGMSTGALAGTPIGGVFIRDPTVANFRHLILFSGIMALVGSGFFAARLMQSRKLFAAV